MRPDGFFLTGDLGWLDEDGYLFIVDRAKDMIISGGENIYTTEVENAIFRHPAVLEVAAFGIPHVTLGENERHRGGDHRHLPKAHWRLQGPALGRDSLGAPAEVGRRQDSQTQPARPILEGQGAARELRGIV